MQIYVKQYVDSEDHPLMMLLVCLEKQLERTASTSQRVVKYCHLECIVWMQRICYNGLSNRLLQG